MPRFQTLRTVARRALVPNLALSGRTTVVREGLRKPGDTPRPVSVALRGGALRLDAAHRPDWLVFDEVFVWGAYPLDFRGAAVIDLGAHRGLFAAHALLGGARHVDAYEPAADNLPYLQTTLASFGPERSTVHACVIGSDDGTAKLFTYDQSWSHSLVRRADRTLVEAVEVPQVSFAAALDAAQRHEADRVVVKIDAEGAEYEILLSVDPPALAAVDALVVEAHGYADGHPSDLVHHLEAAGLAVRVDEEPDSPHSTLYAERRRTPFPVA